MPFWSLSRLGQQNYRDPGPDPNTCIGCGVVISWDDDLCDECAEDDC